MNVRWLGPYGWMFCGSLSFSFMAVCSHAASHYCDWQIVVLARAGLVMVFAAALAAGSGVKFVALGPPILWLRSFAGSASMMLTFYALTRPYVPAAYVLTLTNLFPLWVAILSWPLLGEIPPPAVWLAVASGVTGVVLIQDPTLPEGAVATWVALGASICSAVAMLGLHHVRGIDPLAIVVHFSAVAFVSGLVCFLLFDRQRPLDSVLAWQPILLLLGVGVSATVGQWFLTLAFTGGNPSRVSVIGLSQVVFVMAIEACGGAHLTLSSLAGTLLILVPTGWFMIRRPASPVGGADAIVTADVVPPPVAALGENPPAQSADAGGGGSNTVTPEEFGRPLPRERKPAADATPVRTPPCTGSAGSPRSPS